MATSSKKICFVVGPIGDDGSPERNHADWLLCGIIEPVFNQEFDDYSVVRADKIATPGMINSQVINHLLEAELVIADMSFQNANAFYEMGIRHLKALPVIHMFLEGQTIPFDVKPYRAIPFKFGNPKDVDKAKDLLIEVVREIIKPGYQVENPVTRARGREKFDENATEAQRLIVGELQELRERVQSVESRMATKSISVSPMTANIGLTGGVSNATLQDFDIRIPTRPIK